MIELNLYRQRIGTFRSHLTSNTYQDVKVSRNFSREQRSQGMTFFILGTATLVLLCCQGQEDIGWLSSLGTACYEILCFIRSTGEQYLHVELKGNMLDHAIGTLEFCFFLYSYVVTKEQKCQIHTGSTNYIPEVPMHVDSASNTPEPVDVSCTVERHGTASYLLGNSGQHAYNGNPAKRSVTPTTSMEEEIKRLHFTMVNELNGLLSSTMEKEWIAFTGVLEMYLQPSDIADVTTMFQACSKLERTGNIKYGEYHKLKTLFSMIENQTCNNIVDRYSTQIMKVRTRHHRTQQDEETHATGAAVAIGGKEGHVVTETFAEYGSCTMRARLNVVEDNQEKRLAIESALLDMLQLGIEKALALPVDMMIEKVAALRKECELTHQLLEKFTREGYPITAAQQSSIILTFHVEGIKALNELWYKYKSGRLLNMLQKALITDFQLVRCKVDKINLELHMSEEDYHNCMKSLVDSEKREDDDRGRERYTSEVENVALGVEDLSLDSDYTAQLPDKQLPKEKGESDVSWPDTETSGSEQIASKVEDVSFSPHHTTDSSEKDLERGISTDAERILLAQMFADGTEKDFNVRINFVGFTGAGKTSLMYQMFLKIFSPSDIESTNLIDISIGYCSIDLNTGEWRKQDFNEDEQILQRINALTRRQTKYENNPQEQKKPIEENKPSKMDQVENMGEHSDEYLNQRIEKATLKSGRKFEEANANGIDYAGQATYYALHQLFMSERGVNLIVLDGSRDFSDPIPDEDFRHIGIKKEGNTLDFFQYWSNLLRFYLPNRTGRKHIITVFTHKDLIQCEEKLEERKSLIKDRILKLDLENTFFDRIYCINTNDPKDTELQELRQVILEFSKQEVEWGKEMPSTFLLLEDKLMHKKRNGIKVMTFKEVESLNDESSPKINSCDGLLLFLRIHHEVGTLMHFAKEGLSEIVILNPQWLIDSLKLIICAKRFRNVEYCDEWNRLQEKGIVDREFMYKIWEKKKEDRFFEFKEQLVTLLNRLDLISSPREYDEDGKYANSTHFIVPCMLQNAPNNFVQRFCTNASHANSPLKFQFKHSFLPSATVYRLLATCVMEFGEMKKKKSIFCDAAAFKVAEFSYLILEFTCSSIMANIITFFHKHGDVGLSQGLREFLTDTLQCILTSQNATTEYDLLVGCGNTESDEQAWISWQHLLKKSIVSCDEHESDPIHVVNYEEILRQWSLAHANERRHTERSETIYVHPAMKDKPNHFWLGRISRRIPGKNFHELFTSLGLDTNVIDNKERESPEQVVLLLLIEWSRLTDSPYQLLADILIKQPFYYTLALEEICQLSCEWRKDVSNEAMLSKPLSEATDKELDNICRYVGAKYLELGLEVEFIKEDIDAFKKNLRWCFEISRHIIQLWIKRRCSEATWETLGDKLYEIGCDPNFIKEICCTKYSIQS